MLLNKCIATKNRPKANLYKLQSNIQRLFFVYVELSTQYEYKQSH